MKASIFNFLGEFSSTLEELALRVEDLLWDQPQEAMMKARLFGETLVSMIFEQENMNEVYPLKQWEKIDRLYRHDIIQDDMYKKFEYIRKNGNIAVHQVSEMDLEVAKQAHQVLFDLSVWYAEVYVSHTFTAPEYELPSKQIQDPQIVKKWMEEYQDRIAEIEIQLEQLKQEKKQQQISVKEERKMNSRISTNSTNNSERSVPIERFQVTFETANFEWKNLSKKAAEFKYKEFEEEDTEAYVYLLDNVTPTIAVHPTLIEQTMKWVDVTSKPLKSTALRRFPRKVEENTLKSNYGYTYTFQTKGELESLLVRIVEVLQSRNCELEK
ncbi:hypothetical protein JOD29_000684 [Lysinibacillus composti]|uniref:DUF4145 domain-containing protein n=1 Tax=Lysinibacillus composti TaxID=720633 RepID=A0A3N9UIX6_9BACI|nr:DUF4145 domain-containing protein [Lysinibacillus composti]MBM7607447.1 hypothetical protein [Lysinibacillus composti]RQW75999.1 DUF4145 domain-containing protein [Lysinibacillus composti]